MDTTPKHPGYWPGLFKEIEDVQTISPVKI